MKAKAKKVAAPPRKRAAAAPPAKAGARKAAPKRAPTVPRKLALKKAAPRRKAPAAPAPTRAAVAEPMMHTTLSPELAAAPPPGRQAKKRYRSAYDRLLHDPVNGPPPNLHYACWHDASNTAPWEPAWDFEAGRWILVQSY